MCRGVLQMIATRDIKAGEEVVNDYGALSNAELLRAYGQWGKGGPAFAIQEGYGKLGGEEVRTWSSAEPLTAHATYGQWVQREGNLEDERELIAPTRWGY